MSYQSNNTGGRVVQEYDSPAITGSLLLPGSSNINSGASNSARGGGTTTTELVSKLRFLNCGACLFIIFFHTLRIVLNPVRLTLLLSNPMKLILELIVGFLAVSLFLVEARIPVLGEKVLLFMRRLSLGKFQCIDLNMATGRVSALVIIGVSMVLINYLNYEGTSGKSCIEPVADQMDNSTAAHSTTTSETEIGCTSGQYISTSTFVIFIQCTAFSPAVLIVFILVGYTVYIMHTFPDLSQDRAYSLPDDGNNAATTSSSGPSWVSNVGQTVQGSGYQTLNV